MHKTILVTGSTDGIGLATATSLAKLGHTVLLHGRSQSKLETASEALAKTNGDNSVETYSADLSKLEDVKKLAEQVADQHEKIDVLINNAGVFMTANPRTADGKDIRFVVNTIAPYLLSQLLLPRLGESGRIVNLSSAAQAPVKPDNLDQPVQLSDNAAYAQSKLALTMWSRQLGLALKESGPLVVAVNPGSFLGSKMVKEAYGRAGGDIQIGADILVRAAVSDEFANAHGFYFDNDAGRFSDPHPDALNDQKTARLIQKLDGIIAHHI